MPAPNSPSSSMETGRFSCSSNLNHPQREIRERKSRYCRSSDPEKTQHRANLGLFFWLDPAHKLGFHTEGKNYVSEAQARLSCGLGPVNTSPKFLTQRQGNSFFFNHRSGISGCLAWEHPDQFEGPLLQRGRLGHSLDPRPVRLRGQVASVASPGPQVCHQRLQAL